jgi:hypothetical protein
MEKSVNMARSNTSHPVQMGFSTGDADAGMDGSITGSRDPRF